MGDMYIGEPPDSVISYADKLINGKILSATTVACYSVCEAKGATMPSEKTPQNLSSCISSIAGGYSGGDLDVPVTGNITGIDDNGYSVTGGVCGAIGGDVWSNIDGHIININGAEYAVYGNVYGNVCGGVYGAVGSVYGVYGDVGGNVCGAVYGNIEN